MLGVIAFGCKLSCEPEKLIESINPPVEGDLRVSIR